MRKWILASLVALAPIAAWAAEGPPDWAYPAAPAGYKPPPDDGLPKHIVGSPRAYTEAQINDTHAPPDWFPNEHPPMPDVVAHGKAPQVNGCAQCHLANGHGHPESANLSGLPEGYIEEQLAAFKSGDRQSSIAARSASMARFARGLSPDEIKAAAGYFSSMKHTLWTKVVETEMVPKSFVGEGNMRFANEGGGMEPIGRRVIELPQNEEEAKKRDPHSGFIAYVPKGSIAAGQKLVMTGGDGKTIQCTICHGPDLKGVGNVPGIAGRSAIYLFRQLYDIQHGTRRGNSVALMEPVVKNLTEDDMIDLVAYVASRQP
jgi:cytochrome c553